LRTIRRGGEYLRVADPDWLDPLDPRHAQLRGGRWNPPDSFPVVYLCGSIEVARANVYRKLEGQPYGPEDLDPRAAPILVATRVREGRFADLVTARGLSSAGLPATYPLDSRRRRIPWSRCQPVGLESWELGHPGIACRTAAPTAPARGEELAWFQRGRRRLRRGQVRRFDDWFW
jgi:RES domain-containing protein